MAQEGRSRYIQNQNCARCGSCTAVCPVYRASGGKEFYSARGRQHLRQIGMEEEGLLDRDVFFNCLLCGACKSVCPRDIDTPSHVRSVRENQGFFPGGYKKHLVKKVGQHPEMLGLFHFLGKKLDAIGGGIIPAESGLRLRLAMLNTGQNPQSIEEKGEVDQSLTELLFYPGCATEYLASEVMSAHKRLFAHYGFRLRIPKGLTCCATASLSLGDFDGAAELSKKNIRVFEKTKGPILVSCASCYARLSSLEKAFVKGSHWHERALVVAKRFVDISIFLTNIMGADANDQGSNAQKYRVFYHDPCHGRHSHDVTKQPRALIKNHGGLEIVELVDGPQCCGLGGLFHIESPEISRAIRDDLAQKVFALQPDIITTTCSGCLMQWRAIVAHYQKEIKVLHLTETLSL